MDRQDHEGLSWEAASPRPPNVQSSTPVPPHRVFTAQHEANLATGVGGDGTVGVAHHGEEGLAELAHLLDEVQMQPLAFTWGAQAVWAAVMVFLTMPPSSSRPS